MLTCWYLAGITSILLAVNTEASKSFCVLLYGAETWRTTDMKRIQTFTNSCSCCSGEDPKVGPATQACNKNRKVCPLMESRKQKGTEADQETPDTLTWWQIWGLTGLTRGQLETLAQAWLSLEPLLVGCVQSGATGNWPDWHVGHFPLTSCSGQLKNQEGIWDKAKYLITHSLKLALNHIPTCVSLSG